MIAFASLNAAHGHSIGFFTGVRWAPFRRQKDPLYRRELAFGALRRQEAAWMLRFKQRGSERTVSLGPLIRKGRSSCSSYAGRKAARRGRWN